MLADVEQALKKYFPKTWSDKDMEVFLGKARFERDMQAINGALNLPIREIVFRGGKRLRPLLFLTLMNAFGENPKKYLDFACLMEIVHNGTLVVDDVEDNSELRRGRSTLHKMFGVDIAINAGAAMYFLPLSILLQRSKKISEQQRIKLFQIYAEELISVHVGQAIDIYWHKHLPHNVSVDNYFEMCRLKTGSLMRFSARFACVLANQDKKTEDAFKIFAESIGIAFQIKDDVLDVTATRKTFGKAFGNDITEGKLSLPIILALKELSGKDKQRLRGILLAHTHAKSLIREAHALIRKTHAVDAALAHAQKLYDEAWQAITGTIRNGKSVRELQELTKSFIEREY